MFYINEADCFCKWVSTVYCRCLSNCSEQQQTNELILQLNSKTIFVSHSRFVPRNIPSRIAHNITVMIFPFPKSGTTFLLYHAYTILLTGKFAKMLQLKNLIKVKKECQYM